MHASAKRHVAPGAAAVFAGTLGYLLSFRHYGFQLEDEGTILFHLASVADGSQPYADFFTAYTPGFYRAGALAFAVVGETVARLRVVLAFVNALTATGIYLLATPLAGRALAVAAAAAWVAALPVHVGEFASFNVPYPSWLTATCWIGLTLALRAWLADGRLAWPLIAGVLAACAAACKINAGGATAVAALWIVAAATRGAWTARALACVGAAPILWAFSRDLTSRDAIVFLLPALAVCLVAFGPRRAQLVGSRPARPWPALAAFAIGAVAVSATWITPVLRDLGIQETARSVLLLDSPSFDLYRKAYPELSSKLGGLAAIGAALLGCSLVVRRAGIAGGLLLAIAASVAVAGLARTNLVLMPEGVAASIRFALQDIAFLAVPLLHVAGAGWLARASAARSREVLCIATGAICMYWEAYPRTDFMHLIVAMPLSLALGAGLLARAVAAVTDADAARALRLGYATAGLGLAAVLITPGLRAAARCEPEREAADRLDICLEAPAVDDLNALRDAARYVRSITVEDEPILTFPALAALSLAAHRGSAVPHAWWFPGLPDRAEEHAMLDALRPAPPRVAAATNDRLWIFHEAPRYYDTLRAFVQRRYRLAARFGRYDVFVRRDVTPPPAPRPTPEPAVAPEMIRSTVAAHRRQAIARLGDRVPAALPDDLAAAILTLRAVRDGGDLRSSGLVLAGLAADHARVRREARGAAQMLSRRTDAAPHRWANDFPSPNVLAALAPYRAGIARLHASESPIERQFAATVRAVEAEPRARDRRPLR